MMENDTYVLIWKANTAIRRIVKPEGGIVRIAVGMDFLEGMIESNPDGYLAELSEIKADLYNQVGYSELEGGAFGLVCSRMVSDGLRVTCMTLQVEEGMLVIKTSETKTHTPPIEGMQIEWHNVKKEGRKK